MSDTFDKWCERDICDLIDAYPMAAIVGMDEEPAVLDMPVLLERDAHGKPEALLGHLPRRSAIVSDCRRQTRAMFIFRGPSAYISPAMAGRDDWAPTWNFVTVSLLADIRPNDILTDEALGRTVSHMERDQVPPWSIDQLGDRYSTLKKAVIGFRARILSVSARFKLGQDETAETFAHIVASLGDEDLKYWMTRMRHIAS